MAGRREGRGNRRTADSIEVRDASWPARTSPAAPAPLWAHWGRGENVRLSPRASRCAAANSLATLTRSVELFDRHQRVPVLRAGTPAASRAPSAPAVISDAPRIMNPSVANLADGARTSARSPRGQSHRVENSHCRLAKAPRCRPIRPQPVWIWYRLNSLGLVSLLRDHAGQRNREVVASASRFPLASCSPRFRIFK